MHKQVSTAVIRRLPKYYRYLQQVAAEGREGISSLELSAMSGYTASQIRQDLNQYGGFGQQGYGYNVEKLLKGIQEILGLTTKRQLIIVGVGNLGHALANSDLFDSGAVELAGLFDPDPHKIGEELQGLAIQPLDALDDFLADQPVDIAVLTTPAQAAQDVALRCYAGGVHTFWNFAAVDLNPGPEAIVESVHLSESLITLLYYMKNPEDYKGVN